MVDRLQGHKIVVVDLDGTLIDGNSLHLYICTAMRHSSVTANIKIGVLLLLRRLRFINHKKMKFGILRIIRHTEALLADFSDRCKPLMRPEICSMIDRYRKEGTAVILATAAPDVYVPTIWEGQFVATRTFNNPTMEECRGENKVAAIMELMKPQDLLQAVITDHYDDLPLLRLNTSEKMLVHPDKETLKRIKSEGIEFTVVK